MRRAIFLLTGLDGVTTRNVLLTLTLLLGLVVLIAPRRQAAYQDFVPLYGGARCLVHGGNPYSWRDQQQQVLAAGGPVTDDSFWVDFPIAYPPLTYVLLSPVAVLRWPQATLLWALLTVLAFAGGALALIHVCRSRFRWLAVCLAAGLLATSQLVLIMGQITLLDIGLLALGCALMLRRRLAPGLLLLALAVALKPQLGGLILAYFLIPRRTRRPAAVTLAALALLAALSGLWFAHRPQTRHWPAELRQNIAAGQAPGGAMDPLLLSPLGENEMLSLQQLTQSLSPDRALANRLAWTIAALIGLCLLFGLLRMPDGEERDVLAIAALAMLALTPVYHRLYDMRIVLLTLPALTLVAERCRRCGGALTLVSGFLFLSTSLLVLKAVGAQGRALASRHAILQLLLGRQQALAVLLLALAYTAACWRFARQPALHAPEPVSSSS